MGNCFTNSGVDNKTTNSTVYKQHNTTSADDERSTVGAKIATVEKERGRESAVGKIVTPNLKMFTLDELKSATRNFRPDTVLGEGGFGRVFKGWIDENTLKPSKVGVGIPVAVKKSNADSLQGLQEWQSEVKFLGKFSHPNLVKLLGYCWEENQFLLVYECMQKGSLESHLFRSPEPLSWEIRLKIAIGAAKGLAFLHTSEKSVIYRDFKSSNILLDGDFNAKLSDFGLAKLGPVNGRSHVTTRIMGTYGYAAPEYMATGHLYVKSDVYGFGVVLLEMLTGLIALDPNRPAHEMNLVEFTKTSLSDKKKLKRIMDQRLDKKYPLTSAFLIAQLILKCLESDPKNRPSMEKVLETLEKAQTIKVKPKVKKSRSSVHQKTKSPNEHITNSFSSIAL
ncbi:putative serine/threonine-protein kinase PIX13 [Trifolium repens]|nr:putative serine/threonine-protein kinase PIX13 [Trifolium repens]